jgi:glutamate/tyrosine decarboxylase-like PLP-dependent enzyme
MGRVESGQCGGRGVRPRQTQSGSALATILRHNCAQQRGIATETRPIRNVDHVTVPQFPVVALAEKNRVLFQIKGDKSVETKMVQWEVRARRCHPRKDLVMDNQKVN